MIDVVAYTVAGRGYAWCGWCRQWRSHGSLGTEPVVRPSGCSKTRNEDCPTRDDALVLVWPVPIAKPMGLYSGDGYFGGPLPKAVSSSENVPPVATACDVMQQHAKAVVRLAKVATDNEWRARVQSARGSWAVTGATGNILRLRVIDATVATFRRGTSVIVVSYHDGMFKFAFERSRGRLGARAIKPLLQDEG